MDGGYIRCSFFTQCYKLLFASRIDGLPYYLRPIQATIVVPPSEEYDPVYNCSLKGNHLRTTFCHLFTLQPFWKTTDLDTSLTRSPVRQPPLTEPLSKIQQRLPKGRPLVGGAVSEEGK